MATQKEIILAHLMRGKAMSSLDCYRACGTLNAHKRVAELEEDGHQIIREYRVVGGVRIRHYKMGRK